MSYYIHLKIIKPNYACEFRNYVIIIFINNNKQFQFTHADRTKLCRHPCALSLTHSRDHPLMCGRPVRDQSSGWRRGPLDTLNSNVLFPPPSLSCLSSAHSSSLPHWLSPSGISANELLTFCIPTTQSKQSLLAWFVPWTLSHPPWIGMPSLAILGDTLPLEWEWALPYTLYQPAELNKTGGPVPCHGVRK